MLLHLHCAKDTVDPAVEAASIAAATGVSADTLVSRRPFDAPLTMPMLEDASSIVIGGSAWSVFEPIPYYTALGDFLHEARRRGLPVFGICFGAQALADVFGGMVERDYSHREIGTIEVVRTPEAAEDPLFRDAPARFLAQAWHRDRITALPSDASLLATSQDGAVAQAFRLGRDPIWGVQFHPERTRAVTERMLAERLAHRPERRDAWAATLRESPDALALLRRFAAMPVS